MATDKQSQYNQLAWELEQLKQEYYNQGGTGQIGGGNLLAEMEFKQGSGDVLAQIQKIQSQMAKMEPSLLGNPQDYIQAPINVQNYSDELTSLLNSGVPQTDPRAQALIADIKQQNALIKQQQDYNTQLQSLHGSAQDYIKSQKGLQATEQSTDQQIASLEKQITKLQNQKVVDAANGKDTSAIDKQISSLQAQNQKAQVQYFNAKSELTPLGAEAAANSANALEQSQVRNRTAEQITGVATPPKTKSDAGAGAGAGGGAGAGSSGAGAGGSTSDTGFNQLDQYGQPIFTKVNQTGPESLTPVSPMDATASGPLTVNDQLTKLAKQYGAFGAMALANPWMLNILNESVNAKGGALPTQAFIDKIQADPRWAQMGQSMQKANEDFYGSGGAAWYTQYDATWKAMYNSAVSQGLDPSALGPELKPSDTAGITAAFKDTNNPVTTLLNTYYDDPQTLTANLDKFVATHAKIAYNPASGTPQGAIAANISNLKNTLADYGMSGTYTDAQLQDYSQKIQGGISGYDLDSFKAQQQQNAINTYKPFAEQLKSGQTVSQIAAPYMTTLTGLLEVQPSDVTLGSNTGYGKIISDALRGDANGNVIDPLSFANTVRQQPQWLNTKNAQSTLLGNANAIIQKMGLG